MQLLVFILLCLIAFAILYFYVKHTLKHRVETITCFTGGLGSGKTLLSVKTAKKIYLQQVRKWKRKKRLYKLKGLFMFKKQKPFELEKPKLFSNIPIRINRKQYAYKLTKEHLLLQEKLPLGCVILIDEIGAFASQFDYNQHNVIEVFDEFVRFYRHYTKGGYIVCNDQCSENINLTIRRRINKIHNLSNCFVLWRFCFYYERMMNISEEIKTIDNTGNDDEDTQDNMRLRFTFLWSKSSYDTYCYSDRYNPVPTGDYTKHEQLKSLDLLKCPKDKQKLYQAKTFTKEVKK